VASIVQAFRPVEILVNNAGITRDCALHKITLEQRRSVIDVDLGGCFNTCRAVIESMRERRCGRIVNISLVNGLSGQFGQTNYAAAKVPTMGLTKAAVLEGASRGITVNAIAPGYTDTGMMRAAPPPVLQGIITGVPVGRLATLEEIARTARSQVRPAQAMLPIARRNRASATAKKIAPIAASASNCGHTTSNPAPR